METATGVSDERVVQVRANWLAEAIDGAASGAWTVVPWSIFGVSERRGVEGITNPSAEEVARRLFKHPSVRTAIEEALPEIAKTITAEHRADFEQRIKKTEGELSVLRKLAAT